MTGICSSNPSFATGFRFEIPEPVMQMACRLEVKKIRAEDCAYPAKVDLKKKIVTVNSKSEKQEALSSLIFELHNLASMKKFSKLETKIHTLSADEFVERKELLEYDNVQAARKMMRKLGIKGKLDSINYDFDVHYLIQQASGHSRFIVNEYATITKRPPEYRGTWYHPIETEEERIVLFTTLVKLKESANFNAVFNNIPTKTYEQITKTEALKKLFPSLPGDSAARSTEHFENPALKEGLQV